MGEVQITVDLPYSVEVVWSALTDRRWLSEWFMPTDLAPVAGSEYRAFPPPGLAGFTAAFAIDVVEVLAPQRLVLRFRGEQLHADVRWELIEVGDESRLLVSQTGFLGLQGESRRAEILNAYGFLFRQRLPALLARLAVEDAAPVEEVATPVAMRAPLPVPDKMMVKEKPRWRVGMLSILGSMILTVLAVSTIATMMLSRPDVPAGVATSARGAATAVQPGVSPLGRPGQPTLSVSYHTDENLVLGYIGSITIHAGPQVITEWTATIELAQGATVTSAWDEIDYRQSGRRVTFSARPCA